MSTLALSIARNKLLAADNPQEIVPEIRKMLAEDGMSPAKIKQFFDDYNAEVNEADDDELEQKVQQAESELAAPSQTAGQPQSMLDWALDAVHRGYYVFPVKPGCKDPLPGSHGLLDATNDPEKVKVWWTENPDLNPAVNLGMSNKTCMDYDTVAPFLPSHGKTFGNKSGRINPPGRDGGYHDLYEGVTNTRSFWVDPALPLHEVEKTDKKGNTVKVTQDALGRTVVKGKVVGGEIRSHGAYIVWAGALHPSGQRYKILHDLPLLPWDESAVEGYAPAKKVADVVPVGSEEQEKTAAWVESNFDKARVDYTARRAHQGGFLWLVDCPWDYNHESATKLIKDKGSSCAVIMLPNGAMSFNCKHGHCSEQKWADYRKWMEEEVGHPLDAMTLNIPAPTPEQVKAAQEQAAQQAVEQSRAAAVTLDGWLAENSEVKLELEQVKNLVQQLDADQYEVRRKRIAEKMDMRMSYFDDIHEKAQAKVNTQNQEAQATANLAGLVSNHQPWHEPVNLVDVLNDTEKVITQYIHFKRPEDSATVTLWIAQTYTVDSQMTFPYLGVRSPVENCGKSSVLELVKEMGNRTLPVGNLSCAAAFRVIDMFHPCLIIDEVDTFIHTNHDFVGILNLGHKKDGGVILRVLGENHDVLKEFAVWGPKAYGMIGTAPATFGSRSIPVILERATKKDGLTSFPKSPKGKQEFQQRLHDIARKWLRWATDNQNAIVGCEPDMESFDNRAADNWYPLLRIAALAGDEWKVKALKASQLVDAYARPDVMRLLLRDIRNIFYTRMTKAMDAAQGDHSWGDITPGTLVSDLLKQPTGWDEMGKFDKPITAKKLSDLLENFGVRATKGAHGVRAYRWEDLESVFARYLNEPPTVVDLGGMEEKTAANNNVSWSSKPGAAPTQPSAF